MRKRELAAAKRCGMPSPKAVVTYWQRRLLRWERFDSAEEIKGCCFLCGFNRPLERAHIVALCESGSNRPGNILLLCRKCHQCTEQATRRDILRAIRGIGGAGLWLEAWLGILDNQKRWFDVVK